MKRSTLPSRSCEQHVIVLSNRQPYQHEPGPDGRIRAVRGSSGVVNAVEPLLLKRGGVWVAAGTGQADRDAVERADGLDVPPGAGRYRLRRVWLSDAERKGYYEGFANSGLWPLCHRTSVAPVFDRTDFAFYERVNRRFADVVAEEALRPAPTIFAHDYHFALAPAMIRRQLPRSRIATFWHIPWPAPEVFERCPWSDGLMAGLLGSTLIGFQTQIDRDHFLRCAGRIARIDPGGSAVWFKGRRTDLGVYPATVDAMDQPVPTWPSVAQCRIQVRRELGLAQEAILGVGVDRLDYTKGLEEKLLAVERLLEHRPELRGRFTFAQIAEPSRESVPAYRQTRDRVFAAAARINARFAGASPPVVLLHAHHDRAAVVRFMRAAEFCYVGSLHDGMNLVSKEFVAARADEGGVLILSAYAGASRELRHALIVNPSHVEEVAWAMAAAIDMPQNIQRWRMRQLRRVVGAWNTGHWSAAILADLAASSGTVNRHSDAPAAVSRAVPV